jgi:tight adherence protein B
MTLFIDLLISLVLGILAGLADAACSWFARRAVIAGRALLVVAGAEALPGDRVSKRPRLGFARAYRLIQHMLALDVSRRWGVKISQLTLIVSALLSGVSTWVLCNLLVRPPTWIGMALTIVAVATTPRVLLAIEQHKMEALFLERFPDGVDMVVRALRAGIPLTAAVRAVANEAPPPVDAVFAGLADQTEIGVPLDAALARAATWIRHPDFRFFAVAVALQYATGGNLAATLESLSEIVRKRRIMRLKARAMSAEVRLSTYILSALPFVIVGGLLVISPDYLKPLFADRRGNWILGAAVGSLLAGLFVMRKMMNSVASD